MMFAMKKSLFGLLSLILIAQTASFAVAQTSRTAIANRHFQQTIPIESSHSATPATEYRLTPNPLPATISVPGVDMIPVTSSFPWQSNGRALHNIQVDPSDPNTIHAVLTGTTDLTVADRANLTTRRCFYTVSHDAGKNCTT